MFKFRTLFAILGATGMAIIYGFKVNLSVAIVAMVNQTAIKAVESHNAGHESAHDSFINDTNALLCKSSKNDKDQRSLQVYYSRPNIFFISST